MSPCYISVDTNVVHFLTIKSISLKALGQLFGNANRLTVDFRRWSTTAARASQGGLSSPFFEHSKGIQVDVSDDGGKEHAYALYFSSCLCGSPWAPCWWQQDHPFLHRPWHMLHPCGTRDWMRLLLSSSPLPEDQAAQQYLPSWLSVVGQAVGFHLPLAMHSLPSPPVTSWLQPAWLATPRWAWIERRWTSGMVRFLASSLRRFGSSHYTAQLSRKPLVSLFQLVQWRMEQWGYEDDGAPEKSHPPSSSVDLGLCQQEDRGRLTASLSGQLAWAGPPKRKRSTNRAGQDKPGSPTQGPEGEEVHSTGASILMGARTALKATWEHKDVEFEADLRTHSESKT